MDFKQAFELMKQGQKMKRKEWKGYWKWNLMDHTIVMHCNDETTLDIRNTENVEFTISNILSNDWEKYYGPELTFSQAMEELANGKMVARKCWNGEKFIYLGDATINTQYSYRNNIVTTFDFVLSKESIKANDWYVVE